MSSKICSTCLYADLWSSYYPCQSCVSFGGDIDHWVAKDTPNEVTPTVELSTAVMTPAISDQEVWLRCYTAALGSWDSGYHNPVKDADDGLEHYKEKFK